MTNKHRHEIRYEDDWTHLIYSCDDPVALRALLTQYVPMDSRLTILAKYNAWVSEYNARARALFPEEFIDD